jgi:hypothetical protein
MKSVNLRGITRKLAQFGRNSQKTKMQGLKHQLYKDFATPWARFWIYCPDPAFF